MSKGNFQYSLDDYVFDNMLRDLDKRVINAKEIGNDLESSLWAAISLGFRHEEELQVQAVMKAYYSALNRKNFDEIRLLWLPDDNVDMVLPGFERVVSVR